MSRRNLPERLRSLARRGGILLGMLLAGSVCAPWAAAIQPATLTVVVPYCSAPGGAPGGHAPQRRMRLSFTGTPCSAGASGVAPPPRQAAVAAPAARRVRIARLAPFAPERSARARRPQPRAPPVLQQPASTLG